MQKIRIRTGELEPSSYGFVDRFDEVAYLLAQYKKFRQRYYLLYPETWSVYLSESERIITHMCASV